MNYTKGDMLYDDGKYYKWNAKADHDNPYYTKGTDYSELNRTEGYEVLYFINHLDKVIWANSANLATNQKLEKIIRYSVPSNVKTHKQIEKWIRQNWAEV